MDIIELKAPSPEYAADIWQFRQEILEKDGWKQGSVRRLAGDLKTVPQRRNGSSV